MAAIIFCATYPVNCDAMSIAMPFGLPVLDVPDTTCLGAEDFLRGLNVQLGGFYPIIKLADCILRLIKVVQIIPECIKPPKIRKLARAISALADCATLMADFSGVNIVSYCRLVRDLTAFMICILQCIVHLAIILQQQTEQANVWKGSPDAKLVFAGECAEQQNTKLLLTLHGKLNSVKLLLLILNTIIGAIPPLQAALGSAYPLGSPVDPTDVAALNSAIAALRTVHDVAAACS